MTKELVEEARAALHRCGFASGADHAVLMSALDALAARQPTEDDLARVKKIILESLVFVNEDSYPWAQLLAENILAAVPDAATGQVTEYSHLGYDEASRKEIVAAKLGAEGERDSYKAQYDAATAAIERVRAIHLEVGRQVDDAGVEYTVCKHCTEVNRYGQVRWPCPTVAALDGAPEPEGVWEYRGRLQSCGYVAEGYISAEHAMNGLKVELEDHPYLQMDDTAIVERARVREWLPVEGEKP